MSELAKRLGQLKGQAAVKSTVDDFYRSAQVFLRDLPDAINRLGVEGLLVDQVRSAASTVAEHLDIPFVTVCNAIVLHREPGVPPPIFSWPYRRSWWARCRNQVGWALVSKLARPILELVNQQRREWNLRPYSSMQDSRSSLAQISQQPVDFEFPRESLPDCFHFVGPLIDERSRESVEFPFEKLTDRPLIYASMGTLQNKLHHVFRVIVDACEGLPTQLAVSLGSSGSEVRSSLPEWPLIVDYAPQIQLLNRASLAITHAGLNTALESLSHGVPMIAIPITNDQPGVAARISFTGAGEAISLKRLGAARLREMVLRVLETDSYRANAMRLKEACLASGGTRLASKIIEQAISSREPVVRGTSSPCASL
jgi:MGT family glycosyltransferase